VRSRAWIGGICALLLAVGGGIGLLKFAPSNPQSPAAERPSVEVAKLPIVSREAAEFNSPLDATSLRGTTADGAIGLDSGGALRVDRELRHYFDYWLALIGEKSIAQIIELASADIYQRLPSAQAREVLALLTRYLDYLERESRTAFSADLNQRQREVKALRREALGNELADAFFSSEERATDLLLARRDILRSTPSEQRLSALAALESTRDPQDAADRLDATLQADVDQQTRSLDAATASEVERFAAREALVGADAAARLAELDASRAEWERRLRQFQQQRAQLQADAALSDAARSAAIQALLQRNFSAPEQRRISTLDEIGQDDLN